MPGVRRECAVNLAGVAGPRRPHHEHHHRHPTPRRDVRPCAVTAMHRPAGERLGQVHNGAALDAGAAKGAEVYNEDGQAVGHSYTLLHVTLCYASFCIKRLYGGIYIGSCGK